MTENRAIDRGSDRQGDRRHTTTTTSATPTRNRDMDKDSLRRTMETDSEGAGRQADLANAQKIVRHSYTNGPVIGR